VKASMEESAPRAKRREHVHEMHGDRRVDEYHWLRRREDPDVIRYLEEENAYTAARMKHTEEFQQKLYDEMLSRIKETDLSVPVKKGDYFYYNRQVKGLQYPIFCRKRGSLDEPEEVLLDQNEEAQGKAFFRVGAMKVSPDHRLLAYGVDLDGSEKYTLRIKDLQNGEHLDDRVEGTGRSLAWCRDSRTIYYCTLDATLRPYRVHRHRLGSEVETDSVIFEEADGSFFVGVGVSRSERFILIHLGSHTTSEVWFFDADDDTADPRLVAAREQGVEYSLDHRGDSFYILTNWQAKNFRWMKTPIERPERACWQEIIAHREDVYLEGVEVFAEHSVRFERKDGLQRVVVREFADGDEHLIAFPDPIYSVSSGRNPEFATRTFRFHYGSLVTPDSVFEYAIDSRSKTLLKRQEVLGGYDPAHYVCLREFATAPDGTRIPISLVHRKDFAKDGQGALLLTGYGAYGIGYDAEFSSLRLTLLDRGYAIAIAHIRGGDELGRAWYEAGKLRRKKNSFNDFIACAEYLMEAGWVSRRRLAISGGSAGGLLMGAVINARPELFAKVIAAVPFVDVLTTMLDESLPLTVIEWEEWGNPNDPEDYAYIKSYSPYDNVRPVCYPKMLVTAGLYDPRVSYWEPAKWVARLRATKTDQNVLLLKTNMDSGHSGASGRYDYLKEKALEYAFLLEEC